MTESVEQPGDREDKPTADEQRVTAARAAKKRCLIGLFVWALFAGFAFAWLDPSMLDPDAEPTPASGAELLVGLPLLMLTIAWCGADARQRGTRLGTPMTLLLVLLFGLGVPVYFLWTRGQAGLWPIAKTSLVALGMVFTSAAGVELAAAVL